MEKTEGAIPLKMKRGITYVSVKECAALLGISKSTVYQMLRDGRIEGAFRINRKWRIPVLEPKNDLKDATDNKKNKYQKRIR